MLQNYLKLTLRHLSRNWRYLLINVLGLGFALGFCILAYLNHRFANTYDIKHRDAKRIVRVESDKEANSERYGVCPSALGPLAVAQISGVEAQCRYDSRGTVVKYGEAVFNERIVFTDANFFQFFDFEVVEGTPNLQDPSIVVLDEIAAIKYFGKENPIGKTLIFNADADQKIPLTVGAIVKEIPMNSSLRFHFITHLDNQLDGKEKVNYNDWRYMADAVFLKLKDPNSLKSIQTGLQAYVSPQNTAKPDWKILGYTLEPLLDIAKNSQELRWNNLWHGLPSAAVWGNLTMAILLLLTASLNFANMTIAACNRRLREMGVRKVMGGTRGQLMRQLLGESFFVVLMAMILGMILAYPICDWYNPTWQFTDLKIDYSQPTLMLYIAGVAVFTTLLAGSYPAFYIAGFEPAKIFRGGVLFGGRQFFSQIMMGLQLAISIVTLVVGFSFSRNADYNRTADIGFEYEKIMQAWLPQPSDYQRFENAIRNINGVEKTGGSLHLPGFSFNNIDFKWEGKASDCAIFEVGNNFTDLMEMTLLEGKWPTPADDTTGSDEIIVNQTFVREIAGNRPVIGESIVFKNRSHRISGVMKDFMTNSAFNPIAPTALHPTAINNYQRCLIKTSSVAQQPQIMAALEKEWKTLFPYTPINIGYQNEMMRPAIEVSDNIANSMVVFAGVAILLSITGLFSIISLNVLRRMKEVAIRRVMGASTGQVTWILNKNYGWVFIFSIIIGCTGGWFLSKLLMDSIFKINIGVHGNTLIFSALGLLLIAGLTIALKIWQTMRINPADVLRGD
jgi:putative ABC transport system permease protein